MGYQLDAVGATGLKGIPEGLRTRADDNTAVCAGVGRVFEGIGFGRTLCA